MKEINNGVYPTMITPYKDGKIDFDMVEKLVEWYIEKGCHGVFAVCQSSEMNFLSLKERVSLAKTVVDCAGGRISVVASGHCADSIEEQAEEINLISETGIDAFVWVSNRLDLHNDGDDEWIKNAEELMSITNKDIPLGIYECPKPYKRLLTPRILEWCKQTDRFSFIKDTCCDPDMLTDRLAQLKGSGIKLFNANGQTFLHSLQHGAAGYSGIMANYHPDLYVWLYENYLKDPKLAELISAKLSMAAFTEGPAYPCTAKYYLGFEGLDMDVYSRSSDKKNLTPYQKLIMEQLYRLNTEMRSVVEEQADLDIPFAI